MTDGGAYSCQPIPSGMRSGSRVRVLHRHRRTHDGRTRLRSPATGGNDGTAQRGRRRIVEKGRVERAYHARRLFQIGGVVYMAGVYGTQGWGIYRSTDFAET
jgi:hypothetical protein